MLGLLLDSGDGKETRQGEAHSNTPEVLFMSILNLTENAYSVTHEVANTESQLDRTGQTTDVKGGYEST